MLLAGLNEKRKKNSNQKGRKRYCEGEEKGMRYDIKYKVTFENKMKKKMKKKERILKKKYISLKEFSS